MISGEQVTIINRIQSGVDAMGAPVYTLSEEAVGNVLVAPDGQSNSTENTHPEGVTVAYTLYFPRSWVGSPNHSSSRSGQTVQYITLHIMAGYLAGTDSTFQRSNAKASSTYGVGGDGTIHQYVDESQAAWADGSMASNNKSISIEHQGGISSAANTDQCVQASARLCADIARRYGWSKLEHGKNVFLHREIYPYTHPACPDKAPNPLRWEEIISQANNILNTGSAQTESVNEMVAAIIQPNDESYLVYWDGAFIHPLQHPDEVTALRDAYKQATGNDMPTFKFGSNSAPWATRLMDAVNRRS